MGDFEPRMDKWKSDPVVSGLGLQFKDAIFNKNRLKRERALAQRQAARRARMKRSWLGRKILWLWRAVCMTLAAIVILFIPVLLAVIMFT